MNLVHWFRNILGSDEPTKFSFNVVDPTAIGNDVRAITLAKTNSDDGACIISVFWEDSQVKVFEKRFELGEDIDSIFESMKNDLTEAEKLTKDKKMDEASALIKQLLETYSTQTDELTDMNQPPVTTTNAALSVAAAGKWTILDNGNLEISIEPELQQEVKESLAVGNMSDALLEEVFEPVLSGGLMWVDPADIGALTSAPVLTDGSLTDNGNLDLSNAHIWWYPNYQVRNPLEDLAETGKVIFEKAHEDKTAALKKHAKVVMQNIFFTTPEEAIAYQEKMKELSPSKGKPASEGPMEGLKDAVEGEEGEEKPGDKMDEEMAPPSLSYEQVEKQKASDTKNLDKRIENEVKDQIQSALEKKIATMFSDKDEELVTAMRGVGRTWEEIRDYMEKSLKYDKEGVAAYLDELRSREEGKTQEAPKPEEAVAPAPPADLVSPDTHDKLIDEIDKKEPEEAPKEEPKVEVEEIEKQDGEIRKQALEPQFDPNPLQEAPTPDVPAVDTPTEDGAPAEEAPMAPPPPTSETPNVGDRVYVAHDYDKQNPGGFEGTLLETFRQKDGMYAEVQKDDGEEVSVPLHRVTVASLTKQADHAHPEEKPEQAFSCSECGCDMPISELPTFLKMPDGTILSIEQVSWENLGSYDPIGVCPNCRTDEHLSPLEEETLEIEEPKMEEVPEVQAPMSTASEDLLSILKEAQALLTIQADEPNEPPLPEEKPKTHLRPYKIAPPHTEREKAVPATQPIVEMEHKLAEYLEAINAVRFNLAKAKLRWEQEERDIKESGNLSLNQEKADAVVQQLAAEIEKVDGQLTRIGDWFYKFVETEEKVPSKWDYRKKLEYAMKKFPELEQLITKAEKKSQYAAKTEISRDLIRFPLKPEDKVMEKDKTSEKRLSKLDKVESLEKEEASEGPLGLVQGISNILDEILSLVEGPKPQVA